MPIATRNAFSEHGEKSTGTNISGDVNIANLLSAWHSVGPSGLEHFSSVIQGRRAPLRFALAPGYLLTAPSALRLLTLLIAPSALRLLTLHAVPLTAV
jgi:hypothetical protein